MDLPSEQRHLLRELKRSGVSDPRLIEALETVPRAAFVPADVAAQAYENRALPIGSGQTISQPIVIALSLQALELKGGERVLEIGTGSGYQTALLSRLASEVHTIERVESLLASARHALRKAGFDGNVRFHGGDGSGGWPAAALYDGIVVSAACPSVPRVLPEQLADGGRLVIPTGDRDLQTMELWGRHGLNLQVEPLHGLEHVRFVPLLGEHGWPVPDPQKRGRSGSDE